MLFFALIPSLFTAFLACKLYFRSSVWEFYAVICVHRYQQVSVSDDNLGLAVERQLPNCQCVPAQDRHCLDKSSEPHEAHARAKPRSSAPSSLLVHARRVSNKMCIEWFPCRCQGLWGDRLCALSSLELYSGATGALASLWDWVLVAECLQTEKRQTVIHFISSWQWTLPPPCPFCSLSSIPRNLVNQRRNSCSGYGQSRLMAYLCYLRHVITALQRR